MTPVEVDRERADVDRAAVRRRNRGEEGHRAGILPGCVLVRCSARAGSGGSPSSATTCAEQDLRSQPATEGARLRRAGRRRAAGELSGGGRAVTRQFELLGPPGLDQVDGSSRISVSAAVITFFNSDEAGGAVLPLLGDLLRELDHLRLVQGAFEPVGDARSSARGGRRRPAASALGISLVELPHEDVAGLLDPDAELTEVGPPRPWFPGPRTS